MAARYKCEFKGELGSNFRVEIWDREFKDTVSNIELYDPGFRLSYQNSGSDELNASVLGSEITLYIKVGNSTIQSFLVSLAESYDYERYAIRVFKNSTLWWVGYIRYSNQSFTDEFYPYQFQLIATCGLGLLTEVSSPYLAHPTPLYSFVSDPVNRGRKSLAEIILDVIKRTSLHHVYGDNDVFQKIIWTWKEEYLEWNATYHPGQDSFAPNEIMIHPYNFQNNKLDASLSDIPWKAMQILQELCKLFHLRVMMVNGSFLIEQINTKALTSYDVVSLKKNGDKISTVNTKLISSDYEALRGASFSYYHALREAWIEYANEIWDTVDSQYGAQGDFTIYANSKNLDPINAPLPIRVQNSYHLGTVVLGSSVTLSAGKIYTKGRNLTSWPPGLTARWWANPVDDNVKTYIENAILYEILATRKKPVKIYNAEIISETYTPDQMLEMGDDEYLFQRGTYNPASEMWQGEWWRMEVDRTNINQVISQNADMPQLPAVHPSEEE
jgi:hypothetical protein